MAPAPNPKALAQPRTIDRYQLKVPPIGQGGMGLVYKAYDSVVRRDVALKTIKGSPSQMALDLFRKECSVLAAVCHPNIIEIFDIGQFEENGETKPYFVMPLLPGASLDFLIHKSGQRLTVERVVEIIVQTCRGLHAAHENGIVHRDLKPSNIFVMPDDSVKIIDFGIVHMIDTRTTLTIAAGTPAYMSPEQVQGQPASKLSDIFALGVVVYETLTGRLPFQGTDKEIEDAILHYIPPPVSELNPAVSQTFGRIVHKAMAKQPWYRFSTARDFSEVMQKALRNEPIEIFDPVRLQPRIQRAAKAAEQGDYQFASEILSELEAEGHLDPAIAVLRNQTEKAKRQKTIQQLLDSARTRIEEEEYLLALQKIQEVLQLDPNNVSALGLQKSIERRQSEQKIDDWFRLARQHLEYYAFGHARSAMQNVLQLKGNDARALQMLAEIDRREQEYLRIRTEKEQLYQAALDAWQSGEVSQALTKLERLMELDRRAPDTAAPDRGMSIQSFYNQVRSEHDSIKNAYEEARKHIADRNFVMALTICDQYLSKYPGHALFQALKYDVDERQRQEWSARIAEIDRAVEAEPDLDRRVNILKEALDMHPGEAHFERALRLMRDKRDLVNSIVGRSRSFEERGQFNEAIGQWEILQSVYKRYPGLDFEIERVRKRRDQQARAEAKARWVEQIDRQLESGDYAHASELLQRARVEFPEDAELAELEKLARQGIERLAEAQKLLSEGQDLLRERYYPEGLAMMRRLRQLDTRNTQFQATLLDVLLDHAKTALESDWISADLLIQEALTLDPGNALANSLKVLALDKKREDFVNGCVQRIRNLQTSGDLDGAIAQAEQGLAAYADEPRLVQLSASLKKALQEFRRKREEFVNQCLSRVQEFQAAKDSENALAHLRQALAAYPDEPRLTQALASLQTAIEEAQRQQRESINAYVAKADRLRDAGDLAAALAEIERGLASYPQDPRLRDPQAALKQALERSREEFLNACVVEARKLEKAGDLPGALRRVEQALAAYPAEMELKALATTLQAALQELQRKVDQSVALHLASARERQQAGNLQAALAHIEQGLASHPDDPRLLQFSATLKKALDDSQHRRDEFVSWCLAEARKLQDAGNLESALAQVEQGLSSYPQAAALREMKARLQEALEVSLRKRAEDVQFCLAQARDLEAGGHPEDALSRVEQALLLYPSERDLKQLQSRLQRTAQEARRKTDELVSHVRELQAAGDLEGALRCAEQALASYPSELRLLQLSKTIKSEIQERARAQEESISWCINQARKLREAGDLQGALAQIEQGLASCPREAKLKELDLLLIKEIEESRRKRDELISVCTAEARKYQEAGDFRAALAKVEEGLAVYPGEQRLLPIAASLRKTLQDVQRKRDESVNLFTARARELQEAGSLQAALAEVERGLTSHRDDDRLAQLRSILRRALDESLRRKEESIARFLKQAQVLQQAGNLKGALAQIEQGLASHPGETRLREMELALHEAVEELRHKRNEIVLGCLAQVRELETAGDLERAWARVGEGLSACPDEPRLIEAAARLQRARGDEQSKREAFITACLTEARKMQASGDLQGGIDHVRQGLASYPDDNRLRQLRDALQTALEESLHRREEFVSRCIREIRQLQSSGDLKSALGQIDQALSFYPGEPKLLELHAVLVHAYEEYRRKLDDLVMQCLMRARQLEAKGDLKSALGEIERSLSTYPEELRLVQARAALHGRLRRVWYRRPVVYIPAALIIMVAALVVAFRPKPPRPITAELRPPKIDSPSPARLVEGPPPTQGEQSDQPLKISPERLDFTPYQIGGSPPDPIGITVLQGRIENPGIDPGEGRRWLKIARTKTGILASVQTNGLPALRDSRREAKYSTTLTLKSSKGQFLPVPVTLSVKAAPPPPPPPPPTVPNRTSTQHEPCSPIPKNYGGTLEGDVTWSGMLTEGAELLLDPDGSPAGRIITKGNRFPSWCVNVIDKTTPHVTVEQLPNTNQWRVRNLGEQTLSGFSFHWTVR
jgi:serine/threonine protein kinase